MTYHGQHDWHVSDYTWKTTEGYLRKCHNAQSGTYGHECGKPATWVAENPRGFKTGFCDNCRLYGDERHGYHIWTKRNPAQSDETGHRNTRKW